MLCSGFQDFLKNGFGIWKPFVPDPWGWDSGSAIWGDKRSYNFYCSKGLLWFGATVVWDAGGEFLADFLNGGAPSSSSFTMFPWRFKKVWRGHFLVVGLGLGFGTGFLYFTRMVDFLFFLQMEMWEMKKMLTLRLSVATQTRGVCQATGRPWRTGCPSSLVGVSSSSSHTHSRSMLWIPSREEHNISSIRTDGQPSLDRWWSGSL